MKKTFVAGLTTGLFGLCLAGTAFGFQFSTVLNDPTVVYDTSDLHTIDSPYPEALVINSYTNGAMMAGSNPAITDPIDAHPMNVEVTFDDGTTDREYWKKIMDHDLDKYHGGAISSSWSLSQNGDTGGAPWILETNYGTSITELTIDSGLMKTVFDTNHYPGTKDSGPGRSFELVDGQPTFWDITATYSGLVALAPNLPQGDLYRYLTLEFEKPFHGTLSFRADTDQVPEPSTMLLLGSSMAGLVGIRTRRKKK